MNFNKINGAPKVEKDNNLGGLQDGKGRPGITLENIMGVTAAKGLEVSEEPMARTVCTDFIF